MFRYLKAFVNTLRIMFSGKKGTVVHPKLWAWIDAGKPLIDHVYKTADSAGIGYEMRRSVSVKVDGRDTSMELILSSVRYHLHEDYPFLLRDYTAHSVTAVYANNLNDQYAVSRLTESDALGDQPVVLDAVSQLKAHLDKIPPSNEI